MKKSLRLLAAMLALLLLAAAVSSCASQGKTLIVLEKDGVRAEFPVTYYELMLSRWKGSLVAGNYTNNGYNAEQDGFYDLKDKFDGTNLQTLGEYYAQLILDNCKNFTAVLWMFESLSLSLSAEQIAAADEKMSKDAEAKAVKLTKRPTSRSRGEETLKFSDSDLSQFRKSLIQLRQSIVGKTATLKTNALEQTIDRAGEDEDGSDSFMRLQNLGQVGEQNKTLQKIDEALHRIDDGTYGICEMCGQLIRKARLQHLPFAHTCMECQSEMESVRDTRM